MAVIEEIFNVKAKAIGRVDYSNAVEITTEPFVTSWQSGYNYANLIAVPAGGTTVVNVPIVTPLVVILYDFFASIPSNRMIRLTVDTSDITGTLIRAVDRLEYQSIAAHISKGIYSVINIRFTAYNYAATPETEFVIGCSGMFTTLAEFMAQVSYFPAP